MGRHKTTGVTTRPFSLKLNPAYEEDARAIEYLDRMAAQGFSTRQVVTDALLRAEGLTPEMFSRRDDVGMLFSHLENLLAGFAGEIMDVVRQRGGHATKRTNDDYEDGEDGQWVRTFTKGFLARQQQAMGEEE